MTSNSHDSAPRLQTVALTLCPFVLTACVAVTATDAPAPLLVETLPAVSPSAEGPYHGERVQIRKAQAKKVPKDDPWVKRIVHADDLVKLRDPVLVYAEVAVRFSDRPRTASPVIVLDGQPLTNSIVVRDKTDSVYAIAPSSEKLRSVIRIQVGWFGALPETISPPIEIKITPDN